MQHPFLLVMCCLICPREDTRVCYCTNSWTIPSKLHVPENLKHLKHFNDEHTKSLLFMQTSVSKNLSETIHPTSQRMHRQPVSRKLAGNKKNHVLKDRNEIHATKSLKRTTGKQKIILLSWQKGLLLVKTISPFVNNYVIWDGTVCSGTPSCLQQQQPNHCSKTRTTQI